jgi:hypothetical protein
MLGPRKLWFWFAAALAVVGVAFLLLPPYGEYCEGNDANDYYCAAYSIAVALGGIIEAHSVVITALATVFIGLFTYTLKKSTDKMWDAGERQIKTTRQIAAVQASQMKISIRESANAAAAAQSAALAAQQQVEVAKIGIFDLERAYIDAGPTEITTSFVIDSSPTRTHYKQGIDPLEVIIKIGLKNTGRTRAAITHAYGEFSQANLGESPIYNTVAGTTYVTDLSMAANDQATFPYYFRTRLIVEQFFFGFIEYKDIFRTSHTSRFCMRVFPASENGKSGKFQFAGNDRWRECD